MKEMIVVDRGFICIPYIAATAALVRLYQLSCFSRHGGRAQIRSYPCVKMEN